MPSQFDILLAAYKCECPHNAHLVEGWAQKWHTAGAMWPNICLRALRFQAEGLDEAGLQAEVAAALAQRDAHHQALLAQYAHLRPRGSHARSAGTAANSQLTQQLLDEL